MRKLIRVLLVLAVVCTLCAGCGTKDDETKKQSGEQKSSETKKPTRDLDLDE